MMYTDYLYMCVFVCVCVLVPGETYEVGDAKNTVRGSV